MDEQIPYTTGNEGQSISDEFDLPPDISDLLEHRPPATDLRLLMLKGVPKDEALRIVAELNDIATFDGENVINWTLVEINRLLFLRELVGRGLVSDLD